MYTDDQHRVLVYLGEDRLTEVEVHLKKFCALNLLLTPRCSLPLGVPTHRVA